MERAQTASSNLMDTHNRLIADILTRFRTLMMLATVQAEGERNNANPEAIAVAGISMKMEFDGLYSSIKELLTLSRKIKELWVFGSLGGQDPGQQAKEKQLDRDVAQVADLLGQMETVKMKALAEVNGGTWQQLTKEEREVVPAPVQNSAAGPAAAATVTNGAAGR